MYFIAVSETIAVVYDKINENQVIHELPVNSEPSKPTHLRNQISEIVFTPKVVYFYIYICSYLYWASFYSC